MDDAQLAGQVISAGTALAGLILVFLGSVFTGYDSYKKTEKPAVKSKFLRRASVAFLGFLAAVAAAGCGFVSVLGMVDVSIIVPILLLAASLVCMLVVAGLAILDMK